MNQNKIALISKGAKRPFPSNSYTSPDIIYLDPSLVENLIITSRFLVGKILEKNRKKILEKKCESCVGIFKAYSSI